MRLRERSVISTPIWPCDLIIKAEFKTKRPAHAGLFHFRIGNTRLISVVVAAAIATTAAPVTATTTAKATAATAISTTAKRLVFLRLGFIHFDSTAFYRSAIQLGNRLAGSFIVGHFNKAKSAGPA